MRSEVLRRVEGGEGVLHGAIGRKSIQMEGTDQSKALRQEPVGALEDSKRPCSWSRVSKGERSRRKGQKQWGGTEQVASCRPLEGLWLLLCIRCAATGQFEQRSDMI